MWRSKKFIVGTVLAAVLLFGSIGGIVFAQTENGNDSQPGACHQALLEEACNILNDQGICTNITWEQLRDALGDARSQMPDECQRPRRPGGQGEFGACREALLNKVCETYGEGIDCEKLKAAFADVRSQMPDECQRPKRLGGQGELGACREALLNKVCEIYGEGIDCEKLKAAFADVRSQMPDECQRPKRLGPGGHGGFRGMGGMRGMHRFGGLPAPTD